MKVINVASTAALLFLGTLLPLYGQHEGGDKQEEKQPQQRAQQPQQHSQPQRAQQPAPEQHAAQPAPQQRAAQPQQPRPQAQQAQPRQGQQPKAQESQSRPQQPQQTHAAREPVQHAQQAAPQQQQRAQAQQQQPRQQSQPQRTQQQARTWQQQKGWAQGGGSQGHATFAQDRSQNWSSDHRTWAQRGGYGGYFIPQTQFSMSFGSQHFFRLGVLPVMYLGYPQFAYGGFSFLMVDPWPGDWSANWYASDDVYIDYDDGYYLYNRRYPQERLAITIEL